MSIRQQRTFFEDRGSEHTVTPCHDSTTTVAHEFTRRGCAPILCPKSVIPTVKRHVTIDGQKHIVFDECQPQGEIALQSTTDGCDNQFVHDYIAGRSYQTMRWFYPWRDKRKFVTPCQRSDQFFQHIYQTWSYEHDDDKRLSKPTYQVSIEVNGNNLTLGPHVETDETKFVAYKHLREINHITSAQNTQLKLLRVGIWERPDKSVFEQILGTSQVDIQSRVEYIRIYESSYSSGNDNFIGNSSYGGGGTSW